MGSLQELKNKLQNKKNSEAPSPKILDNIEETSENNIFEFEEARYMLNLISNSEFKGRDVQIVYNVALKLQTILKTLND